MTITRSTTVSISSIQSLQVPSENDLCTFHIRYIAIPPSTFPIYNCKLILFDGCHNLTSSSYSINQSWSHSTNTLHLNVTN
jgi:hypothetical protein